MEIETNFNYIGIISTKLHIGDTWLATAYNSKYIDDWMKSIEVANEGFIIFKNSVNTKKDILNFLSLFDETIKFDVFLVNYSDEILNSVSYYLETLEKVKEPPFNNEVLRLKLM
jgi:hypothetical protein